MKLITSCFWAIAISFLLPSVGICDEISNRAAIENNVIRLLNEQDFAKLESIANNYRTSKAKTSSGISKLSVFHSGMEKAFSGKNTDPAFWTSAETVIKNWVKQYPKSPNAYLAYAHLLINRGWSYRGTDYAKGVNPQNWKPFFEYMKKSRSYLNANKVIASNDPEWYATMLTIGRGEQWTESKFSKLLKEGLDRYPSYDGIYFSGVEYYLPKWYGDAASIEKFARDSLNRTKKTHGYEMYVRIYWTVHSDYRDKLFSESAVDWSLMKKGIDDVIKKYPDNWNINNFAKFACLAGDKAKTAELMERINEPPILKAWKNTSTFQKCRAWSFAK
jgi:hypothetical protein